MKQQLTDTSGASPAMEVKTGGKEVRLHPYVRKDEKTGFLEYCRAYPKDVEIYEDGKRVKYFWRSLNTRNPVEANKAAPERYAEFQRIVESAKSKNVVPYEDRQEFLRYLKDNGLIADAAADIDLFKLQQIILDYQEKFLDSVQSLDKQNNVTITSHHPAMVLNTLRGYERRFQGKESKASILRKQYMIKPFAKEVGQSANERYSPPIDQTINGNRQSDSIANTITFRDAFNKWNKDNRLHRGRLYKEQPVKLFEQVHGQKPLAQVTEEDLMTVITMFAETPIGKPKKKPEERFSRAEKKELTLPELHTLFKNGEFVGKKRNPQTVRKIIDVYASLYDIARSGLKARTLINIARPMIKEFENDNPAKKRSRIDYTADELNRLFHSPLFAGCQAWNARHKAGVEIIRDSYFWLPLIGLFTGCRAEEIGQLSIGDIRQYENVRYIEINQNDTTKRIKGDTFPHYVPIHDELIKCGFLEYYEEIKAQGHTKLFPELVSAWETGKDKRHTKAFSQWYGRYLKRIGIALTSDEAVKVRKDFHSFRHTFKTACRQAEFNREIHDFFTGHSPPKNVGLTYGENNPPPYQVANECLQKIRYPGLDLSHLYVKAASTGKPLSLPVRSRPVKEQKENTGKPRVFKVKRRVHQSA